MSKKTKNAMAYIAQHGIIELHLLYAVLSFANTLHMIKYGRLVCSLKKPSIDDESPYYRFGLPIDINCFSFSDTECLYSAIKNTDKIYKLCEEIVD